MPAMLQNPGHNLLNSGDQGDAFICSLDATQEQHSRWKHYLMHGASYKQQHIRLFGKLIPEPRLTAFYGDRGISYTYSGATRYAEPWTPVLLELRDHLQAVLQHPFNHVLLNYYRNGSDYMGPHRDNEPELGTEPLIATLNFGAERPFFFHHVETDCRIRVQLKENQILVMRGPFTQRYWKHSVPRRKGIREPRISASFRWIESE